MFAEHEAQIFAEAKEAYPEEAVWVITQAGCRWVANTASDPRKTFSVSDQDMLQAYREGLVAIVHSHPNGPDCPSEADMRGQIDSGVPWGIICTDGNACLPITWWGEGIEKEPLIGRGFRHGITDCYSLIRDYYLVEQGIKLPEFPRSWNWWNEGQDLYTDGFPRAGFRRFDPDKEPPQEGDMWFAQLRSKVPNHGGIYLGDETILHHTTANKAVDSSRLSKREPIHRWLPHITHWLRHEEME